MPPDPARPVPVRTIATTIAMVVGTLLAIYLFMKLGRIITWVVIAAFFAVVLGPAVDFLERHRIRRGLATIVVFLLGLGLIVGLLYVFIRPIVGQVQNFADSFPTYVDDARNGRGTIGHLVDRFHLDTYVQNNQAQLRKAASGAAAPALDVLRGVVNTLAAVLTILVLAFLMLLEGPKMLESGLAALAPPTRERVRRVGADCSRALTGYMAGNLLISVIAGVATWIFLKVIGVPFAEVLGLWVAFADLIPLIGATLGAIATVGVAFLHSTPAGIAAIVFYIVYQQFENHVLQTTVMSRTVDLNPLVVLVSVLVGVELVGFLGALLAIPAAGVIQVIARDLWNARAGRPKAEPTVGTEEVPISLADDGAA